MSRVITVRLTDQDLDMLEALKNEFEERAGFSLTQSQVVRLALKFTFEHEEVEYHDN